MQRSKRKSATAIALSAVLLATAVAGCASSGSGSKTSEPVKKAEIDPNKKYKISIVNHLNATPPPKTSSGTKAIEERYNIELDYTYVPDAEYQSKVSVLMASNALPDLTWFYLHDHNQRNYIDNGAFLPIDKYIKDYPNLSKIDKSVWDQLTYKGHIYGVPLLRAGSSFVTWLRKDWLDNLGLKVPTTYDEYYQVLKAFKEKDPDKNGKDDTYGLAWPAGEGQFYGTRGLFGSGMSLGAGATFVDDGKGNFVPGYFGKNAKWEIEYLQKLYREGLISKDFAIQKNNQADDDFQIGKAGSLNFWSYVFIKPNRVDKAIKANPNFEWIPVGPFPAPDGYKGYMLDPLTNGSFSFNANLAKDEGKVRKILQILDDMVGQQGGEFMFWGLPGVHHTVENGQKKLTELGNNEGPAKYMIVIPPQEGEWLYAPVDTQRMKKWKDDAVAAAKQGKPYMSPSLGLVSQTQNEKGKDLETFMFNGIVQIIMGDKPISYHDELFAEWKKRGGEQIMKELAEAKKKMGN